MAKRKEDLRNQRDFLSSEVLKKERVYKRIEGLGKEINLSIDDEKKEFGELRHPILVDQDDFARVEALVTMFREGVKTLNAEQVVNTWELMKGMVDKRMVENNSKLEKHERTTEEARKINFKKIVKEHLPNVSIGTTIDGLPFVTTYNKGLIGLISKEYYVWAMNLLQSKDKKFKGIFDDRIMMSTEWIRVSNQFGGGDPRTKEEVPWNRSADDLMMNYIAPPILDLPNKVKAILGKNPEPYAPFGILELYRGSGQSGDKDIPEIAHVPVKSPAEWVNVFNLLKKKMNMVVNPDDCKLREFVYLQHFWNYGLKDIVETRNFKLFLVHNTLRDYQQSIKELNPLKEEIKARPKFFGKRR